MFLTQPHTASVVPVSIDTDHRYSLRADINFVEANVTLGDLADMMLAAEDLEAGSYAASLCVWHVMYVDTLETEYLAVGDWIAKYVDDKLVPLVLHGKWQAVLLGQATGDYRVMAIGRSRRTQLTDGCRHTFIVQAQNVAKARRCIDRESLALGWTGWYL